MLLARALRPLLLVAVAASVALGAVSCAAPSEPLLPEGNAASGGSGTPGGGGSAGVSGASGGNPTGQGGASAGAAGSNAAGASNAAGGSSGSGGTAPGTGLPDVGCDYATPINKSCAITACHRPPYKIGGLDLTLDTGIKSRLVNKAATFADINCGTADNFVACVPTTCPTGALLVNTAAPEQSYILQKLDNTQGMCGIAMPTAPGDATTTGWSPDEKACLETLVRALASGK